MITWRSVGAVPEVQSAANVLAEIAELAMSGYGRYPWGGMEVGGVLFWKKESGTVYVYSVRPAECEHHYGPAFDLSKKDCAAVDHLLTAAAADEKLAGLMPVGSYHSISRHHMGLSDHACAFFHRFFHEPWQLAMVVKRSKHDPQSIGIFVRDSHGGVDLDSPVQEFALDITRQYERPRDPPE